SSLMRVLALREFAWNFNGKPTCHRRPEALSNFVRNPTIEEHGWQSMHTVIGIINDNMPFRSIRRR
ncbi:MAG: hypothetical protein ACREEM_27765, partial [Blastocatellia bacterium]